MSTLLGLSSHTTVHRKGKVLVVPRGASLPPFCIKCGKPVVDPGTKITFSWHATWLYVLIFLGVLIYVIAALVSRKKVDLLVPVCEEHLRRRRQLLVAGIIVLAGVPVSVLLEGFIGSGFSILMLIVCLLGGLILVSPARSYMRPVYIDESRAEFEGLKEEFLSRLAPSTG